MKEKQTYNELLLKCGLKNTKQRSAIIELLKSNNTPLSAEDIFLALKENGVITSLSTVYRSLDALSAKDIVTKSTYLEQDKAKYSLNFNEHRHHLICLGCMRMVEMGKCPLNDIEASLANNSSFKVTGHKLEIYGYCADCQKRLI